MKTLNSVSFIMELRNVCSRKFVLCVITGEAYIVWLRQRTVTPDGPIMSASVDTVPMEPRTFRESVSDYCSYA